MKPMKRMALLAAFSFLVAACGLNEYGPWLDPSGFQMRGNDMIEFEGFAICDQTQVVFIQFFGDQYAKDPRGVLGDLESIETGEPLSFELLDVLPEGLQGTEITHKGREVYIGEDRPDYLYIRLPSGETERWPRAEDTCQREEPL
jgi:hypothetical protein